MTTSEIKPVAPFTIGNAAEESPASGNSAAPDAAQPAGAPDAAQPAGAPDAAQPAGAPPPELAEAEQARTTAEMELNSAKNEASQKDKLQRDQVALSTAIRPVQRQTEHQLSKVTELRDRIKGKGPKPRGSVFALNKSASELNPFPGYPMPEPAVKKPTDTWASNPATPVDFTTHPSKPIPPLHSNTNYSQGVPYPVQRNYATPISPPTQTYHATPAQLDMGYPEQVAPGTTELPPAVTTLANRGSAWDYASQKDPTVRDIHYGRARTQALEDWQAEQDEKSVWSRMMDNITGYSDLSKELALPIDPNADLAARQHARIAEMQAEQGNTMSDRMRHALKNFYGDGEFTPVAEGRRRDFENEQKALAEKKKLMGISPETQTLGDGLAKLKYNVGRPFAAMSDAFLGVGRETADHLFQGAANIQDMANQHAGGDGNWLERIKNIQQDTLLDAGRNAMGVGSAGFFVPSDREKAEEAAAAAAAAAKAAPSKIAPAVPSESPTNFEDLMRALLPFLGMGNQFGGYDGYGGQRPDYSGTLVELLRVLGNLQREKP